MAKTQNKQEPKANTMMIRRTLILMIVCGVVAFVVLAVRLYIVMIRDHDYYENLAVEQQTRETTINAMRGTIYDSTGKVLAMSATVENVFISPYEIKNYGKPGDLETIAAGLSEILGVDRQEILEMGKDTDSWYKTVRRKIESDLSQEVRAFISETGVKGVHLETDSKRYYPYGSLACHVLGFVGDENTGLEGLEAAYDGYLTGENGRTVRLTNANGTDMLFDDFEYYYDAKNGYNLKTTLDNTIQYIAESYLKKAVEDYMCADGGACIIMNPKTGAIYAMASMTNYDLNNYLEIDDKLQAEIDAMTLKDLDPDRDKDEENGDQEPSDQTETTSAKPNTQTMTKEQEQALAEAKQEAYLKALYSQWRNKCISDTYEPGSVFKIITLAMALQEGAATLDSQYFCGGAIDVVGREGNPVHCWSDGHGEETLTEAVENSCNVAFVQIGMDVGAEKFYEYVKAFGLFDSTGIELSGEADSLWWSEEVFYNPDNQAQLASAAYGQTFTITPLQIATAVSAAVNGGYLMQPYLVEEVTDNDGNIIAVREPTVVRSVISEENSAIVREILSKVVSDGTGSNAQVPGYNIGGKTGTSEDVAYEAATGASRYIVSFCGIAPMDDPEVVVLLLLKQPSASSGTYVSGGAMAAPTVGAILSEVLPYLGIDPSYSDEELQAVDVQVPNVKGNTVDSAKEKLLSAGFSVRVVGDGATITGQLPAANSVIANGSEVIIYAGQAIPGEQVAVPNLYGMTYAQAVERLAAYGLYARRSGGALSNASSTIVSRQSVAGGTMVGYGTVIELTLVDTSNLGRY